MAPDSAVSGKCGLSPEEEDEGDVKGAGEEDPVEFLKETEK